MSTRQHVIPATSGDFPSADFSEVNSNTFGVPALGDVTSTESSGGTGGSSSGTEPIVIVIT